MCFLSVWVLFVFDADEQPFTGRKPSYASPPLMFISPWSESSVIMPNYVMTAGKPLWDSEEHFNGQTGYDQATTIVDACSANYIAWKVTKTVFWHLISAFYPFEGYYGNSLGTASTPWSGNYQIYPAIWGYAHYNQFVQLGWQYVDGACGYFGTSDASGTFVTLKSTNNADFSIIIETKGATTNNTVTFNIGGGLPSTKPLCVWMSNPTAQFIQQSDITPVNGSFTITLATNSIYSISTTTGQQKGSYPIPATTSFPFPYYETYDHYTNSALWGYTPYYNVDVQGVFEITERPDGTGQCLRQVVPQLPISWAAAWAPESMVGDVTWSNYEVSAEVYFDDGGWAGIMGRVGGVNHLICQGYYLRLSPAGAWGLYATTSSGPGNQLASGQITLTNTWHNLKLRFSGSTITGFVEGSQVCSVTDTTYAAGMVGFITGDLTNYNTAMFDNLIVNPVGGATPPPTRFAQDSAPPYAPVVFGLTATAVKSQVQLQWNANVAANSYIVERSLVTGGPYTVIASNLTATSFTDPTVSACGNYYYVVAMMNGGVESVPSLESAATLPPAPLPPQFLSTDIGTVGLSGRAGACGNELEISGSGADIWGTNDAGQFVYAPLTGSGSIMARVDSVQATDPWAKACVMIRESTNAGACEAIALISAGQGAAFQFRTNTGGATQSYAGPAVAAPYMVWLGRNGNVFSAYCSLTGATWSQIGQSVVINMASNVYVGLAVTAHNNNLLCTSVFDEVSGSVISNPPPAVAWITPTNDTVFNQPQTITLTASATEFNGTVTNVALFDGTNLLGNVITSVGNQYSLFWSNAAVGSHTLSALATDNSGATNTSPAAITIEVQPLTLTVFAAAGNGQFSLTFQGQNGQTYVLETSTNLAVWTPVWTNAPTNGLLSFTNLNATDQARFYRVSQ